MRSGNSAEAAALQELISRIREMKTGPVNLMEVCGSHTMAIAKGGIRQLLPDQVRLISGPGCPVCVTPPELIDMYLHLTEDPRIVLATYGDMLKVPGSRRGDTLMRRRAEGARVQIVYSPMDAWQLAQSHPEDQVVFLGAGFETSAPGTAAALQAAAEAGTKNFSVLSLLKRVEPALRQLISDPAFNIQGFLCPGHVATILGEAGFRFLPEEYHLPGVISGFTPEDILVSVWRLLRQLSEGRACIENTYTRAVAPEGNPLALRMMNTVLCPKDDLWRGLGAIPDSGLGIREEYRDLDAAVRFGLRPDPSPASDPVTALCRCGEIIKGQLSPRDCPLFGSVCTPEDPVGPCMVSGEGACAAAWKYQEL